MTTDDPRMVAPMPVPRVLRALRGAQWLVNAYALYRRNPGAWVLFLLALLAAMVLTSQLKVIGPLIFGLVFPVFSVGIALAAQAADRGEPVVPAHFFGGFRSSIGDLVAIGGIYLIGQLMIVGLMMAIGGAQVAQEMAAGMGPGGGPSPAPAPGAPAVVSGAMALAGLVGLSLLVPLLLATWFAPLLVFFHGQKALPSLLASLGAALRNWRAFMMCFASLLLGMILVRLVVSVLVLVPGIGPILAMVFLGMVVSVIAPVGFIAFYTSYVDVFDPRDDAAPDATPDEEPDQKPEGG